MRRAHTAGYASRIVRRLLTPLAIAAALASVASAQGRIVSSFPYAQSFDFIAPGTATTPAGPIGAPVFPATDVSGGELTVDAGTSANLVNGSSTGLNNNVGAGGVLRIQTSGSVAATMTQGFILHASFTGRLAGAIGIDWAKVVNGTSTRASELRIAASAGGGAFVDVAAASFDNSAAAQSGRLATPLPASLNGVDDVRFRIYAINVSGTGTHPRVVVDNLALTATDDAPLPVELASLSVAYANGHVLIDWRTASEHDNEGFEILRAGEDSVFSPIASFLTHDALRGLGTSAVGRSYRFDDELPAPMLVDGARVLYRLVDIARDGSRGDHGVREARVVDGTAVPADQMLHALRLDDVVRSDGRIIARWSQSAESAVAIDIVDARGGRSLLVDIGRRSAGSHEAEVDLALLPEGSYLLVLHANGTRRSSRFVVAR